MSAMVSLLGPRLLREVRERLGIVDLSVDSAGLHAFYRAWCLNVPFDNLHKMRVIFAEPENPYPMQSAQELFENFLAYGIGGTCWPHANAMYALLRACGFDARRATGSMYDFEDHNHGTVFVTLDDGSTWILDNAMLTVQPLRVDRDPLTLQTGVHFAEVEHEGDALFVHGLFPPFPYIFCHIRERDVDERVFATQWEKLRRKGAFNERLHIQRATPDALVAMRGANLYRWDGRALETTPLDEDGVLHHLATTMGVDRVFVRRWADSGALASTMTPPSGPPPVLPVRPPPSKR
jgi:arylamine N-acetyltransferase